MTHRLLEYFVLCGVEKNFKKQNLPKLTTLDDKLIKELSFEPQILSRFPEKDYGNCPLGHKLPNLCFPHGVQISKTCELPRYFTFVIQSKKRKIYCGNLLFFEEVKEYQKDIVTKYMEMEEKEIVNIEKNKKVQKKVEKVVRSIEKENNEGDVEDDEEEEGSDNDDVDVDSEVMVSSSCEKKKLFISKSYCLMSSYPFFHFLKTFITELYRISITPQKLPIEKLINNLFYETPLPPPGKICVQYSIGEKEIVLKRPKLNCLPLLEVNMKILFNLLSIDNIIFIFHALLSVRKVLFSSKYYSILHMVMESFISFLYPFGWDGFYIPIVPTSMLHFIAHCPNAFIMGVNSDMYGYVEKYVMGMEQIILVDLDRNKVQFFKSIKPELPKRQQVQLKRDLRSLKVEMHPELIFQSNPDLGFSLAPIPSKIATNFTAQSKVNLENEESFNFKVREIFVRFFVSLFHNYDKFVIKVNNVSLIGNLSSHFQRDKFLKTKTESEKNFLEMFLKNPSFGVFLSKKLNHDDSIMFFENNLTKSVSNVKVVVEKYRKKYIVRPPDNRKIKGEKNEVYIYEQFPKFQKFLFSKPRFSPNFQKKWTCVDSWSMCVNYIDDYIKILVEKSYESEYSNSFVDKEKILYNHHVYFCGIPLQFEDEESVFKKFFIDSSNRCNQCRIEIDGKYVKSEWNLDNQNDYTVKCSCNGSFVPQISVKIKEKKGVLLKYTWLSPVVLKKEVENLILKNVYANEELPKKHPLIFWNIIHILRDLKIYLNSILFDIDWNSFHAFLRTAFRGKKK